MASVDDLYKQALNGSTGLSADLEAFAAEFPHVWDIFRGRPYSAEDPGRPPATILVFAEGGKLKFCIKPKQGGLVAFGTVEDASRGLHGVDKAIADGHVEWKKSKVR